MHKAPRTLLSAGLCLLTLAPALAGPPGTSGTPLAPIPEDPRIDQKTGRLLATWPKDRLFDHLHMSLEIDIEDITKPHLDAVEKIALAPLGIPRSSISLDCWGPEVSAVTLDGQAVTFSQQDQKLTIAFPKALPVGKKADLTITYSLDFPTDKGPNRRGQGLTFSPGKADTTSLTTQSTQIHAQGEAELNSRWFPCLDHPSEKLTTEIACTVEDGYEVVSNGHLASKTPVPATTPDGTARTRWHWVQDKNHPYYLVTLVVGKLAIVDVGGDDTARPGLPMPVYTPFGTEDNVKEAFANTPDMVAFFERTFDEPYAWDKYAQVLVRDFAAGGMENTSCTLLTVGTSRAKDRGSQDDLISHELAHQWFGDLATCRSWDHLWLNEGWATYCEALWNEHKGALESPEKARAAYERSFRHGRGRGELTSPQTPAIVSNRFTDPDTVFTKADNPYGKGSNILNMLRCRLGEATFYKGVHNYLERYKFGNAETEDFRREMEAVSGQSLERFFAQWFYRPGRPQLEVDESWDESKKELTIAFEQSQTIDDLNPAYAITIPVFIKMNDKSTQWTYIDMDTHTATATLKLPEKPASISIDPNNTVYCGLGVRKELAMWINEAQDGPSQTARLDAIDYLKELDSPEARTALAALASAETLDPILRSEANRAIAAK